MRKMRLVYIFLETEVLSDTWAVLCTKEENLYTMVLQRDAQLLLK